MLTITSPDPVRMQCDGDLIGQRTCVRISSVRHALAVVG
jgi:diacylglycerol kinase family enzyme